MDDSKLKTNLEQTLPDVYLWHDAIEMAKIQEAVSTAVSLAELHETPVSFTVVIIPPAKSGIIADYDP